MSQGDTWARGTQALVQKMPGDADAGRNAWGVGLELANASPRVPLHLLAPECPYTCWLIPSTLHPGAHSL